MIVRHVALAMAVLLCTAAARGEPPRRTGLAEGQNALLAAMLGQGRELPGGCRFADGSAEDRVEARYACTGGDLRLSLYFTADAPPGDAASAAFTIVVRDGTPPPGFLDALVASLRAHEGALQWIDPPPGVSEAGARAWLMLAIGLALLGAALQFRSTHPRPPDPAPADRTARLALAALAVIFLLSRLVALTAMPVFVDESIHVAWARGAVGHPLLGEFSVGKWLPVELMRGALLLPLSPLAAARLAAVVAGLAAMLGCAAIGRALFSTRAGLLAAIGYAALPFTLLYDRMALADVYVLAFGTWSAWFALRLRTPRRAADGAAFSLLLSACTLSKPTGAVFAAVPLLVAALLLPRGARWPYLRALSPSLLTAALLAGVLVAGGYGADLLRGQSTPAGLRAGAEIAANLHLMLEWLTPLLTPAVIAAAAAGALLGVRPGGAGERFLAALLLVLLVPWVLAAQVWYPRYLLPAVAPIVCLAARAIEAAADALLALVARRAPAARRWLAWPAALALALAVAAPSLSRDRILLAHPERADLPLIEVLQYVEGAGAGYGLPELAAFLEAEARRRPIAVAQPEAISAARFGVALYLSSPPPFTIETVDRDVQPGPRLAALTAVRPLLLISDRPSIDDPEPLLDAHRGSATRVWSHLRPGGRSGIEVWELGAAPPASPHGEARPAPLVP